MVGRRMTELVASVLIGDGVLALLRPEAHSRLWQGGPPAYADLMETLSARPNLARVLGAVQIVAGLWLAVRQQPVGISPQGRD